MFVLEDPIIMLFLYSTLCGYFLYRTSVTFFCCCLKDFFIIVSNLRDNLSDRQLLVRGTFRYDMTIPLIL